MNSIIRTAKTQDYAQLMGLMQQLQPADPPLAEEQGMRVLSYVESSDTLQLWVMEKNGTLVGSVYLNIIPNLTRGARPYAVIENVVTHQAHRRQGIGKQLMLHALTCAKDAGCYKVMLLTGREPEIHGFYQSCGLEKGGKQAFIYRF